MRQEVYGRSRSITKATADRRIAIIKFLIDKIEAELPNQGSIF